MNDGQLSRRKILQATPVLGLSLLAIGVNWTSMLNDQSPKTDSMSAMLTDESKSQAQQMWIADPDLPEHHVPPKPLQPVHRRHRRRHAVPSHEQATHHNTTHHTTHQHPAQQPQRHSVASGSTRRRIREYAAAFYGVPYVWGGESPRGFDCSGLTQWVFRDVGLYLPRTSEDQGRYTYQVRSPKMGDLVFFGSPAYHVGIYDSSGYMIAAPHTGSSVKRQKIWSSSAYFGRHPKLA